jgi:glycosyltransferase involved in cell wall biosynthesis
MTTTNPSQSLRIAQVAPLWLSVPPTGYGGAELIVYWLTEELVKRGYDVTLYASGDSKTNAKLRAIGDHCLIQAMAKGDAYEYEHYANSAFADAIGEGDRFDIIHCHLGYPQIPLAALSKTPVLYSAHIVPSLDDLWVLRRYPNLHIAASSQHQANAMSLRQSNNIRVIHHGIDFSLYESSETHGKYLAFIGRMGPQKSPLDAIRIANASGMPIMLAGKPQNAAEEKYFTTEIKPLINGTSVTYVGAVNHQEKNELLKNAAALLFPIQGEEAFGIIMIEAMACGTPVVAIDRASTSEVIDYGKTGFYAESIDELASLVAQALRLDRNIVREQAMRRFSHKRMVDDYIGLYKSLISDDRAKTHEQHALVK